MEQSKIPQGLRWTLKDAEKHLNKHSFIRVGGEKLKTRILSGAPKCWESDDPEENEIEFNLTYRIAGTPNNITLALRLHDPPYDEDQINECLANTITKYNYQTTKKEEYDNEIKEREEQKRHNSP